MEDKQSRSVFVGNIPHGATEEQMRDVFEVVGNLLSFRIVYDRETGNPKGYGFAEYTDVQTAQSAIRNLNGFEYSGRSLRVDKASSQADELRMVHQQAGGPPTDQLYGEPVPAERAPETISRAVANLPPEMMFELMKQVKASVAKNPTQVRQMLIQNPQLAYALLQAQVVMRVVDPQVAVSLLYQPPLEKKDGRASKGPPPMLIPPPTAHDPSTTVAAMAAAAAAAAAGVPVTQETNQPASIPTSPSFATAAAVAAAWAAAAASQQMPMMDASSQPAMNYLNNPASARQPIQTDERNDLMSQAMQHNETDIGMLPQDRQQNIKFLPDKFHKPLR